LLEGLGYKPGKTYTPLLVVLGKPKWLESMADKVWM